ncbi:hypothetical protein [Bradyrhizobium sp. dw_411]|nr:hypothetical protein [Bradyrhizobium sp. dw_411]
MPFDSMLVSAAVLAMFVVFAGVLMWGEIQTRPAHLKAEARSKRHGGN